jgi:hypothetical protein
MEEKDENTQNNFRKRSIIVDVKFQLTIISSFFKIYLISAAGFYLIVTLLLGKLKMFAKEKDLNEVLELIQGLETNVIWMFLGIFIISSAITYYYGFKVTHKIYGPIFAMNKHLAQIKNGEEVGDLKLRSDDYFMNLQANINETVTYLKKV